MQSRSVRLARAVTAALIGLGLTSTDASAQMIGSWTDLVFVSVNFGTQTKARQAAVDGSQPLYDETASWEATASVGNAAIVDIGGGVRVWRNVGIGLSVSRYKDSSTASVSASIPDPLFFDRPHAAGSSLAGLDHSERAVHLSAVFLLPVADRVEIMVLGGPSFFSLKKALVTGITVPAQGVTIGSVTQTSLEESATGGHIAVDVTVALLRNIGGRATLGVGGFARYGSAKVSSTSVRGGTIELGGLNYGGGLRLRF